MHQQRRPASAGFTLIELMIVIAIIGILLAVLISAVKRHVDGKRNDPANRTAAVQLAEQQGIRTVEIVASWRTRRLSFRDQAVLGCLGGDESVLQVEGIDRKEQRVRLTVCCRPAAGTVKCAIPLPMHAFPGDR